MYFYMVTVAINCVNLHNFSQIDLGEFWGLMCKIWQFFYFTFTDLKALRIVDEGKKLGEIILYLPKLYSFCIYLNKIWECTYILPLKIYPFDT